MKAQVSYPFVRLASASNFKQLFVNDILSVNANTIVAIARYETVEDYLERGSNTHASPMSTTWLERAGDLHDCLPLYELVLEKSCWQSLEFEHGYVLAHTDSRETIAHLELGTAQHLRDFAVILEHAPRLSRLVQQEMERAEGEVKHARKKSRLERGME